MSNPLDDMPCMATAKQRLTNARQEFVRIAMDVQNEVDDAFALGEVHQLLVDMMDVYEQWEPKGAVDIESALQRAARSIHP